MIMTKTSRIDYSDLVPEINPETVKACFETRKLEAEKRQKEEISMLLTRLWSNINGLGVLSITVGDHQKHLIGKLIQVLEERNFNVAQGKPHEDGITITVSIKSRTAPFYIINGQSVCIFGSHSDASAIASQWQKDLPDSSIKTGEKTDADWIFQTRNSDGGFTCDIVGGTKSVLRGQTL